MIKKYPLTFITAIVLICFSACKKMQVAEVNTAISNEESANMIAGVLASSSNGLNNLATDITTCSQHLFNNNNGCGAVFTDSVSRQSAPNSATTFSFKNKITSNVNCNAAKAFESVTSSSNFVGQYNGVKLSARGSGSSSTTITGLDLTASAFKINGQLKNMSAFKIKADTTRRGTIAINIVLKDLTIAKPTSTIPATISSGTATATVTGNSPKGAFLFEGTLTFNGFNDATLVLVKDTYTINLITGAVVKRQ